MASCFAENFQKISKILNSKALKSKVKKAKAKVGSLKVGDLNFRILVVTDIGFL